MNKITILIMGLGIAALAIFIAVDFGFRGESDLSPEPFLCGDQPCNVILLIPETLPARHLGIYGYERNTTPFIDEFFSQESLIFENHWSTAPWTLPSFAALFTSQLASEVFLETYVDRLSKKIPTFVDVLEKNGIPKFAAYTWTLQVEGFDWNLITRFKPEERFQGPDSSLFLKASEWISKQTKKDDGNPFFLLLQLFTLHEPYDPPEPYRFFFDAPSEYPGPVTEKNIQEVMAAIQRGEDVESELRRFRLQYDQEVRYIDGEFESLISQIPEEILSSTIFIFTADHGESFGQHGGLGHGRNLYQDQIHVPLLIRVPGIAKSRRIQELTTHLDLGSSILEIFGLKSPDTFRGASLLPLIRGEKLQAEDRIVRAEHIYFKSTPEYFERLKTETLVRTVSLGPPLNDAMVRRLRMINIGRFIAVRKGKWKMILERQDQRDGTTYSRFELYNLEQDPQEQNDLIYHSQWYDLSKEEQAEIFALFEALHESFPW